MKEVIVFVVTRNGRLALETLRQEEAEQARGRIEARTYAPVDHTREVRRA